MDGTTNKYGFLEKIVATLNTLTVSGVRDVVALANVFSMLATLKSGMEDEDKAKNQIIEMLKDQLKRATENEPEDGGDKVGGETYTLDFTKDGASNGTD